jgi:hypothetical protein
MTKKDFKRILKPLIKECIKEVMFEEGVLSTVITEVVKGTQTINSPQPRLQMEKKQQANYPDQRELLEERRKTELERKRKLLDAAGFGGIDIFEGTTPISQGGSMTEGTKPQGLFSELAPGDAGIDISGIMSLGASRWKTLAKGG